MSSPSDRSDNPYRRQTPYGSMAQAPMRVGPLPKAPQVPATPPPRSPSSAANVRSGSAIDWSQLKSRPTPAPALTPLPAPAVEIAPPPAPSPVAATIPPSEPLQVPEPTGRVVFDTAMRRAPARRVPLRLFVGAGLAVIAAVAAVVLLNRAPASRSAAVPVPEVAASPPLVAAPQPTPQPALAASEPPASAAAPVEAPRSTLEAPPQPRPAPPRVGPMPQPAPAQTAAVEPPPLPLVAPPTLTLPSVDPLPPPVAVQPASVPPADPGAPISTRPPVYGG